MPGIQELETSVTIPRVRRKPLIADAPELPRVLPQMPPITGTPAHLLPPMKRKKKDEEHVMEGPTLYPVWEIHQIHEVQLTVGDLAASFNVPEFESRLRGAFLRVCIGVPDGLPLYLVRSGLSFNSLLHRQRASSHFKKSHRSIAQADEPLQTSTWTLETHSG